MSEPSSKIPGQSGVRPTSGVQEPSGSKFKEAITEVEKSTETDERGTNKPRYIQALEEDDNVKVVPVAPDVFSKIMQEPTSTTPYHPTSHIQSSKTSRDVSKIKVSATNHPSKENVGNVKSSQKDLKIKKQAAVQPQKVFGVKTSKSALPLSRKSKEKAQVRQTKNGTGIQKKEPTATKKENRPLHEEVIPPLPLQNSLSPLNVEETKKKNAAQAVNSTIVLEESAPLLPSQELKPQLTVAEIEKKSSEWAAQKTSLERPQLVIPPPVSSLIPTEISSTTAPLSFSTGPVLGIELKALFDKMVGLVTIQEIKGVKSITTTLHMPNSVFNDAEIIITRYNTAPSAFNVQLLGSPEALKLFAAGQIALATAFEQSNLAYKINLLTPALLSPAPASSSSYKKGRVQDKMKEESQDQGGAL